MMAALNLTKILDLISGRIPPWNYDVIVAADILSSSTCHLSLLMRKGFAGTSVMNLDVVTPNKA
jgi:hypothetical protein